MLKMVNVGFGNVVAAHRIVAMINSESAPKEIVTQVRERGSGITLACGTGACATAVAANLNGLAGKSATVHLDGGDLHIDWRANNHVYMTGAAEKVFAGNFLC